ncbi:MAG TPA: hypothetical protein VFT46_04095 [Holophagaceae bacterium]|nr:hypothetical protein [Holophagaceae bacterium]
MNLRLLSLPAALGLAAGCISPQIRGAMPQGHTQRSTSEQAPRLPNAPADRGTFPAPATRVQETGGRRGGTGLGRPHPGPMGPTGADKSLPPPLDHRLPPGTPTATFHRTYQPCREQPNDAFWTRRCHAIQEFLLTESRRAFIPAVAFPVDSDHLQGTSIAGVGWRAYGFFVPPGGKVRVLLDHPNKAWFNLYLVNKWGNSVEGARQVLGRRELRLENVTKEVQAVYVVVDDPGLMATEGKPYTLTLQRSFDPATVASGDLKIAQGIWN